ncbi:MAG: hypothetical protein AB7E05_06890 [Sphingobium sp.]
MEGVFSAISNLRNKFPDAPLPYYGWRKFFACLGGRTPPAAGVVVSLNLTLFFVWAALCGLGFCLLHQHRNIFDFPKAICNASDHRRPNPKDQVMAFRPSHALGLAREHLLEGA